MATIRSKSSKPRPLPSGAVVPVGGTVEVKDSAWERDKLNPRVATWLRKHLLVEVAAVEMVEDAPVLESESGDDCSHEADTTPLDEADILLAKLEKHGINRTRRTPVEKLRELLAEAEAGE